MKLYQQQNFLWKRKLKLNQTVLPCHIQPFKQFHRILLKEAELRFCFFSFSLYHDTKILQQNGEILL